MACHIRIRAPSQLRSHILPYAAGDQGEGEGAGRRGRRMIREEGIALPRPPPAGAWSQCLAQQPRDASPRHRDDGDVERSPSATPPVSSVAVPVATLVAAHITTCLCRDAAHDAAHDEQSSAATIERRRIKSSHDSCTRESEAGGWHDGDRPRLLCWRPSPETPPPLFLTHRGATRQAPDPPRPSAPRSFSRARFMARLRGGALE